VEAAQSRDLGKILPIKRLADGGLTNTQTGRTLPEIGRGVEAFVYEDSEQGVVYKVYEFGKSDEASIGVRIAIDEGMAGTDTGQFPDVIEKTWAINNLGGTPTEIVGRTLDGEIVVKQPRGTDVAQYQRAQAITTARLAEVPESILPRIDLRSPLYYAHIDGADVLLGDLHAQNFIGDTIGRGRINDLATHVLTAEELQKLPKLTAWIAERRTAAQPPVQVDFARAWHGSPHRGIEKEGFKLHKIGTGTGSQQYGWGIYFAGRREMAERFRKELGLSFSLDGKPFFQKGQHLQTTGDRYIDDLLLAHLGDVEAAIAEQRAYIESLDGREELVASQRQVLAKLEALRGRVKVDQTGQVYSADIPEDHELIAWDKPIEEQTPKIRGVLEGILNENRNEYLSTLPADAPQRKIRIYYNRAGDALGTIGIHALKKRGATNINHDNTTALHKAAAELLNAHGIPGLRYLDWDSSLKGEGTHNYVIWDESRLNKDIETYYARAKAQQKEALTESPAFKAWFGNSKVVDAQGNPLVVYHTSGEKFTVFDITKSRSWTGTPDYDLPGFYFTDDQRQSSHYGDHQIAAYLSLQNPFVGNLWAYRDKHGLKTWRETYEQLKRDGYDGYIDWDSDGETGVCEFVAFSPEQIKSATDNRGTFDASNPDIHAARKLAHDAAVLRAEAAEPLSATDFEARLRRIAPGLFPRYEALIGDYEGLLALGVPHEQIFAQGQGAPQAAHIRKANRLILWFLQQNLRADKHGRMDERLRRDLLHETAHGWLNAQTKERQDLLKTLWQKDITDPNGWLAQRRKEGVELREGLETDWAEYWCERLAYENNKWAATRETFGLAGDRGFVAQLAAQFRQFLQDALDLLARAFTRTHRYNLDFRHFLTDPRYEEHAAKRRGPTSDTVSDRALAWAKAWHGSPHRGIEKEGFKLHKIGTGTGAQQYGWGIYFAGRREMAEGFRKELGTSFSLDGKPFFKEGQPLLDTTGDRHIDDFLVAHLGDVEAAIAQQSAYIESLDGPDEFVADQRQVLAKLEALRGRVWVFESGQLYSADIPEAHELLDWDKPFSEQPEKIKEAFKTIIEELSGKSSLPLFLNQAIKRGDEGVFLYNAVIDDFFKNSRWGEDSYSVYKRASEFLVSKGIPGLRYLDGNSRGAGSHNYVIWDESRLNKDIETYYARKAAQTREDIQRVIDAAKKQGTHAPEKADLGPVAEWVAQAVQDKLGVNISAYRHTLDGSAVRHILNKHGDAKTEKSRGQIAVSDSDIQHVPALIAQPDSIVLGTKTNGHKDQVAFLKRMPDGTTLYLEEIRQGRGTLAAVSMRKYPATVRSESILKTLQEESQKANPVTEDSGHKMPATRDTNAMNRTLPSNAQSDGGNALTVIDAPAQVKHADTALADFARAELSTEERIARKLHELEEFNYKIEHFPKPETYHQRQAYQRLLGDRNEAKLALGELDPKWRSRSPEAAQLADNQVLDPLATRKRILEHDLAREQRAADRGVIAAEKRAQALRRTLAREYPQATQPPEKPVAQTMSNTEADLMRQIQLVIDAANQPARHAPQKADLGPVADWVADAIKQRLSIDVSNYRHVLDGSAVRHVKKRHSSQKSEAKIGQIAITDADFKRLPQVVASPDRIILGEKTDQHKDAIIYIKRMPDGSIFYIEEVRTGRGELASTSMRKYPAARDLSSITATVPSYAQGDGGILGLTVIDAPAAVKSDKPSESSPAAPDTSASIAAAHDEAAQSATATPRQEKGSAPSLLGHTNLPPKPGKTLWEHVKGFVMGFRGYIPEIPVWGKTGEFYAPLRQFYKAIKRSTAANQAHAAEAIGRIIQPLLDTQGPDAQRQAADHYRKLSLIKHRIRKLEKAGEGKPQVQAKNAAEIARLERQAAKLAADAEAQPYHLFNALILAEDYVWRAENLRDDKGGLIALPDGLTHEQALAERDRLRALARTHPHAQKLNHAVQAHLELVAETWAELERRFPELKAAPALLDAEGRATNGQRAQHTPSGDPLPSSTQTTQTGTPQNPFYFPHHIINDERTAKLTRTRLDTAADIRQYLIDPKGSTAPIETDYAQAMMLHLTAVYAHNTRADLTRDLIKNQYDLMPTLRERAKELSEQRGQRVSWVDVFNEEYGKSDYTRWTPDERFHFHSEAVVNRERLSKRLGVTLEDGDLQAALKKAGITQVELLPEDIRSALSPTAKEEWILPKKIAQALDAMLARESRWEGTDLGSGLARSLTAAQNLWKRHILFSPWNYIRYEYNNTTSDVEKLFSADPAVFGELPSALRDVLNLHSKDTEQQARASRDVRIARALGVMQSVTVRELGDLPQLRQFAALKATPDKWRDIAKAATTLFMAGGRSTVELSQLREATFRYAKFKADLNRMRHGARPIYAGAYHRDIETLQLTQTHRDLIEAIEADSATQPQGRASNASTQRMEADTVRARLAARDFLETTAPVATIDGTEFPVSDTPLADRVAQWYQDNGYATLTVPNLGTVTLDKKAVARSMNHGLGRDKAAAFAAVPDVLLGGRIIHTEPMEGSTTGGQVYHVAAPVRIGGRDFVASVLVKADTNINRMYVHEVFLKDKLHAPNVSAVAANVTGKRADKGNGVMANVLHDIYAVNPPTTHTDTVRRTDPLAYVKAAEISLATFGDYDTISVSGNALRQMMIPFYSWIEINFRYHANLFRNLKDMARAGEISTAEARKHGARAAGVLAATFTRKVAAARLGDYLALV